MNSCIRFVLQLNGVILTLGFALSVMAAVPAPPVNQELGFFDTKFNNLTAEECRFCHNQDPPDGIPVDPTYLPDRHHLLMYQPISTPTVVPYPDSNGDAIPDTVYNCLNCHSVNPDGTLVQDFTDCMNCHQQLGGDHHGYSPHHGTPLAQADLDNDGIRDTNADGDPVTYCSECHGSLVNDLGDGHYIPTYGSSMVTPWPSDKVDGDSTTVNSRGTQAGNCNFCHDSGLEDGREVVDNLLSHHGAGFFSGYLGSGPCYWCHDPLPGGTGEPGDPSWPQAYSIKTCEGCHGPDTLHNIQADSPNPANIDNIVVGGEDAGYGHVGRDQGPGDSDCLGCHGFDISTVSAPFPGPTVPHVTSFNPLVINAGEETSLAIHGLGFTNIVEEPTGPVTLTSVVTLESDGGTVTILIPYNITESLINVTVPSLLGAGIYSLRVEKDYQYSNKTTLLLQPQVKIDTVRCEGNNVTIYGNGFSGYLGAVDSGTAVRGTVELITYPKKNKPQVTTTTETGSVSSWSDSKIVAAFSSCPIDVTVNSIFGFASSSGDGTTDPPTGSCSAHTDETSCSADSACLWDVNTKGLGTCKDAGGPGSGGGNGSGKNKTK